MPDEITLYFNPRCSKSRAARELLRDRSVDFRLIDYLEDSPSRSELEEVLNKLGTGPDAIVRKKDPLFAELELEGADPDRLLRALVANPALLERPIVVRGDRAVVARPPERLAELFDD